MKKLTVVALATAFALTSGVALAQSTSSPSGNNQAADSSKSTGTPSTQMNKTGGAAMDAQGKSPATTGAAAQENMRGDQQQGKQASPSSPTPQGATKNAD